jgi:hypothetical protein
VYEFVHHLRTRDEGREGITRTSYPTDIDGVLIWNRELQKYLYDVKNVEESATTAETTVRTYGPPSLYYSKIDGKRYTFEAYNKDRKLLIGSDDIRNTRFIRGREAVDAINEKYDQTEISEARIYSAFTDNRTAKESWSLLKKVGIIEEKE